MPTPRPRSLAPLLATALLSLGGPARADDPPADAPPPLTAPERRAVEGISAKRMKATVDFLAADALGGRLPGSHGHQLARAWLKERLQEAGLAPAGRGEGYDQPYPSRRHRKHLQLNEDGSITPHRNSVGWNVVARLEGSDPSLRDEYILVMAHYDHLGVTEDGRVYNGAFDNAGGVAVALEVARALASAKAAPRRSIVFLFSDDEENGLRGAKAWLKEPTLPLESCVLAISADPLGRRLLPDLPAIVISGAERSPSLLAFWRRTEAFTDSTIAFVHRGMIPLFASDHDVAFSHGIPALWFVNPGFSFYHRTGDTAETIDYRLLQDDARYLARSLLLVGGTDVRFAYEGAPDVSAESGRDARVLYEAVVRSEALTPEERERAKAILGQLDEMIAEGWGALRSTALFYRAVAFLFELSRAHPGEVPPPFPSEEATSPAPR